MKITVLKIEYLKADLIKVNYRDHKLNSILSREKLSNQLNENPSTMNDYNSFQNILCEVLNKQILESK